MLYGDSHCCVVIVRAEIVLGLTSRIAEQALHEQGFTTSKVFAPAESTGLIKAFVIEP